MATRYSKPTSCSNSPTMPVPAPASRTRACLGTRLAKASTALRGLSQPKSVSRSRSYDPAHSSYRSSSSVLFFEE